MLLQKRQIFKTLIKTYTKISNTKTCRRILKSGEKSKDRHKKMLPQYQRHLQRQQHIQLQNNRKDNRKDNRNDNRKDNHNDNRQEI